MTSGASEDYSLPPLNLAESFQSNLIGLSVVSPVAVVAAAAPVGAPIVLDEHCKAYRERNRILKTVFEAATSGRVWVGEWLEDEADAAGVAARVLQYARASDLVVASQTDPDWSWTEWLDVTDRLAIESARPVLIVPHREAALDRIGGKVLVAWNSRREAARAVYDALPILKRAQEVKVAWINEIARDIRAADICVALARHSVRCEATEQVQLRGSVGETLLEFAKEMNADLLVMMLRAHAAAGVRLRGREPACVGAHDTTGPYVTLDPADAAARTREGKDEALTRHAPNPRTCEAANARGPGERPSTSLRPDAARRGCRWPRRLP